MATTTAAARRVDQKAEYDAFLAGCPSREVLGQIASKWVMLVLSALGSGPDCTGSPRPMRYSELARTLAGVSPKMLSQTLRSLERDGFITRTASPTVPVTVTYELTDLGLSLHQALRHLKHWSESHYEQIAAHRTAYDSME